MAGHSEKVAFIWSVADLLRGAYRQSDYQKVILPFVVLRRLDCVLEGTKDAVLKRKDAIPAAADAKMRETMLNMAAGQSFHNLSPFTFQRLKADAPNIEANLIAYLAGFSGNVKDVFIEKFELPQQIARLDKANLLYLIVSKFTEIDLHPDKVSNLDMGYIFEELIRRFAEQSNETAGEHFTPREVIRLMVNLLLCEDTEALTQRGVIRKVYDPACGTGGMLSVAEDYLRELNPDAQMVAFGQELNPETFAVCQSDMLLKGQNATNIGFGNTFTEDRFPTEQFDYCLSNPPFGVEWKNVEKEITAEHERLGTRGRFSAGLPRVSDGSLLFVQHMISKFRTDGTTSRLAVVLNGSPLFTGSAGSGESEIRRWIIENDWLEAIIGLPDQLFYNTGISTYVWVITNRKSPQRRGKVQLIDATGMFEKMRKSLGNKRNFIPESAIREVTRLFGEMAESEHSKVFDNEDFGYWRITVERPLRLNFAITPERIEAVSRQTAITNLLKQKEGKAVIDAITRTLEGAASEDVWQNRERFVNHLKTLFKMDRLDLPANVIKAVMAALSERDESADICMSGGKPEPDPDLRDTENVPLKEEIATYFAREVLPHVPEAWVDEAKTRKGYDIPFTRHFYRYVPTRPLEEIDSDLKRLSTEIQAMLREMLV